MNISLLQEAVEEIKKDLEASIRTATFNGALYESGQRAKEALIRSQQLILKVHEVVKISLDESLARQNLRYSLHPPLGLSSPELAFYGLIKSKKQDIVVTFDDIPYSQELITDGPVAGSVDHLGKAKSEKSIVVGVRSQLSSVAKNFDTLMERTFAETLNLRLRLPSLVMGEVYLLPIVEYDDKAMQQNQVAWKASPVAIEKFISTFLGISGRSSSSEEEDIYKYERTALILVDFRVSPLTILLTTRELKEKGYVSENFTGALENLSPVDFAEDTVRAYIERHRA